MPFIDLQRRLGISLDKHLALQTVDQPFKIPTHCHAFEKEWIECAHGIGKTRAQKECKLECEDLTECLLRLKTVKRMSAVNKQRDKLMKEGTSTPPPHHLAKGEPKP